ncbi:ABC transporter permease [Rathayibacter sp. CAU 1779]
MSVSSPVEAIASGAPEKAAPVASGTRRIVRLPPPGVLAASVILVLIVLAAFAPQLLAGQDPLAVDLNHVLAAPSPQHLLGTDENGRDVYARLVYGTRTSLWLGFGAVAIGLIVGSVFGIAAGLGARWLDLVLMRLVDVGLAFPEILLALVVIAVLGGGTANALIAIGVAGIPSYARLVRAQTLTLRRAEFVEAARALGVSRAGVIVRHVLPNAIRPVLVLATIGIGTAAVAGAALSFLGLGTPPPNPEWGSMLSTARNYVANAWWYSAFPGLAITLLVCSTTVVGRYLQRRLEGRGA